MTIEVKDKEFLVLVGPSGCGKSTCLRLIAGLEEVSAGNIYIGDRLVNDVAPKDRDIAMVFQSYALYPHMSVYDNLAFGLRLRHTPKKETEGKVVVNAHVRVKRVALEDHRDVAVFRRHVVDQAITDVNVASADFLETGDQSQAGGL